ncbi:hypothetical protein D3Z30_13095 [Staphylococcus warneri]|uniref:Jacalin-type lectin domain-containing protein n=1 Tax=Staphylococcus warneri TaxID=1292 RepID=A0AB36BJ35_STAWA|nr:hypothetical protein [Staphylococcus warneri]
MKVGPWGGTGGDEWEFDLGNSRLLGFTICSDSDCIHSIQFLYLDGTGIPRQSDRYGGDGGEPVTVDFVDEAKLIQIEGTFGKTNYDNRVLIKSLSFRSNVKKYGPYGPGGGTAFDLPVEEGKVVGFFGRYGGRLDSFGVILKGGDA